MSLLDDPKLLAGIDSVVEWDGLLACRFCPGAEGPDGFVHALNCPAPSLSKIVAALEIVKALAQQGPRLENLGAGLSRCQDCAMEGRAADLDVSDYHAFGCPWRRAKEVGA